MFRGEWVAGLSVSLVNWRWSGGNSAASLCQFQDATALDQVSPLFDLHWQSPVRFNHHRNHSSLLQCRAQAPSAPPCLSLPSPDHHSTESPE
ncbi:hypothetical protein M0R45_017083 [Rubus argutus]|uniref:Secreted protein n=1 Tax=Rubus argutus TaxID=59490 RepID=A0AAW1XVY8_RUBAR